MSDYTETEKNRVLKVGRACADFVEVLVNAMGESENSNQAEALFMSAVESLVDGVYYNIVDEISDEERHRFARSVYKDLLLNRMHIVLKGGENGADTENADGPLC